MRKLCIIIFIILMIFSFTIKIKAEVKIKSFACYYKINSTRECNLGEMQVIVDNYNDGNGKYSVKLFYTKEDKKLSEYKSSDGTVSDYLNHDVCNGDAYLTFFSKMKESETKLFFDYFKKNGKCMTLYYNDSELGNNHNISSIVTYTDNNKVLESTKKMFKGPNDSNWVSEEEFNNRSSSTPGTTTDTTKPFICKYNMNLYGTTNMSEVQMVRNVYNGNISYYVKIDGVETNVKSLNERLDIPLAQYTGGTVRIESSDLKAIFNRDDCLPETGIYHYLDNSLSQNFIYYITVDANKASSEGALNLYGNGTGEDVSEDPGYDFKLNDPTKGFNSSIMNCNSLLGPTLTPVFRAGIRIIQIAGAIIAIVKGTMIIRPAITSRDGSELVKSGKTLATLGILIAILFLFPTFMKLLGKIAGFDISCLV